MDGIEDNRTEDNRMKGEGQYIPCSLRPYCFGAHALIQNK